MAKATHTTSVYELQSRQTGSTVFVTERALFRVQKIGRQNGATSRDYRQGRQLLRTLQWHVHAMHADGRSVQRHRTSPQHSKHKRLTHQALCSIVWILPMDVGRYAIAKSSA
jgi:hypothetical protein